MSATPSPELAPWNVALRALRQALKGAHPTSELLAHLDVLEATLQASQSEKLMTEQAGLQALYTVAHKVNASLDWTETLDEAIKALVALTGAERGALLLLDDQGEPQVRLIYPVEEGSRKPSFSESIVSEAIQQGSPIFTHDAQLDPRFSTQESVIAQGLRSVLCAPLIALGRPLGAIYLEHRMKSEAFRSQDLTFLGMAAELIALALTNAQKYQYLQQRLNARTRNLKFLQDMMQTLQKDYNYPRILHQSLQWAMQAVGAARGALGTLEVNGLRWQTQQGGLVSNYERVHSVLRDQRPVLEPTLIILPLTRTARPLGVLTLESGATPFNADQHTLIQSVATVIALFLENARLYEGLRQAQQSQWDLVHHMLTSLEPPLRALEAGEAQAPQNLRHIWNTLHTFTLLEEGRYPLALLPVKLRPALFAVLEAHHPLWVARDMHVELDMPESLPPVLADPDALTMIFTQLLRNAILYTPPHGRVYIQVDLMPDAPGFILCSIEDTGYGINQAEQEFIFTPFFRSQRPQIQSVPGSGLGLAIVKRLVEIHGGQIGFRSLPDEGSTFYFTLPKTDGNEVL